MFESLFEFLFNEPMITWRDARLVFESGWPAFALVAAIGLAWLALGASLAARTRRLGLGAGRRSWLGFLQGIVVACLLAMLWRPALEVEVTRPGENTVAWLVDVSASMDGPAGTDDSAGSDGSAGPGGEDGGGPTRRDAALDAIEASGLVEDPMFEARLLALGDGLAASDSPDALRALESAPRSAIAESLASLFDTVDERALAAVVLVSDGAENANGVDAAWWRRLGAAGVPVHVVGVGETGRGADIELVDVEMPERAPAGSTVVATLRIAHAPGAAPVRLRVAEGDALLLAEDVALSSEVGETVHVARFRAPETGLARLDFDLRAAPGETDLSNNRQSRMLRSDEERYRVLYVEGEPRWEYKFLRRALDDDAGVEIASLLRTSPNKFYRQGIRDPSELADGFPKTREALFAYDAVIVGSLEASLLDAGQQAALRDFVNVRGGALLMLGGRRGLADGGWARTPVAAALPVVLSAKLDAATFRRERVRVVPTRQGLRTDWLDLVPPPAGIDAPVEPAGATDPAAADGTVTDDAAATRTARAAAKLDAWLTLPELADVQDVGRVKPGAVVLLETAGQGDADARPVFVRQRYGLGTSQVLGTGGTWRWQMRLPSDDQRHESFWRGVIGELAAGSLERFELAPEAPVVRDAASTEIAVVARDADFTPLAASALNATLLHPDGTSSRAELVPDPTRPGRFVTGVPQDADGPWGLRLEAVSAGESPPAPPATVERWWLKESGTAEAYGAVRQQRFLERVAASTGGSYFDLDGIDRLPQALASSNAALTREQRLPLWNMPAFFLLILLAKSLEWLTRLRWHRL